MAETLLERDTGDFPQEVQVLLLLPSREHLVGLCVGDPPSLLSPGLAPSIQRLVVDETHARNRPSQEVLLFRGRVEVVAECSLQFINLHSQAGMCNIEIWVVQALHRRGSAAGAATLVSIPALPSVRSLPLHSGEVKIRNPILGAAQNWTIFLQGSPLTMRKHEQARASQLWSWAAWSSWIS